MPAEAEHPGRTRQRTAACPTQAPASLGAEVVHLRGQMQRAYSARTRALGSSSPKSRPACCRRWATRHRKLPHPVVSWCPVQPIPVWQLIAAGAPGAASWPTVHRPAYQPGAEDEDLLDHRLQRSALRRRARARRLHNETWADLLSAPCSAPSTTALRDAGRGWTNGCCWTATSGPTTARCVLTGPTSSTARTPTPCKACAALLHKDCLAPGRRQQPVGSLDENAHKHAFGVSEDLKYALREAIELLGNEAARQLDEQASGSKKSVYSGQYKLDPADLSLECLRMVYRLLFMFYIEARPELGYVPIAKSEVYLKGYSLESCATWRCSRSTRRMRATAIYFDATLRRLFKLVAQGCGLGGRRRSTETAASLGAKDTFPWPRWTAACSTTAPCRCWTRCASPTTCGNRSSA
jgi:hypothetical protein